jgi:hypothetical protein
LRKHWDFQALLKDRQLAVFESWRPLKRLAALAASENTHLVGGLWQR